jgi:hypothetical protein
MDKPKLSLRTQSEALNDTYHLSAMPTVTLFVSDYPARPCKALVDTGSNISFVTEDILVELGIAIPVSLKQQTMQTMCGTYHNMVSKQIRLSTSIVDSVGMSSDFARQTFFVYPKGHIPGGFDVLLGSDWVLSNQLDIRGTSEGYSVILPTDQIILVSRETSTADKLVLNTMYMGAIEDNDIEQCEWDLPVPEMVSLIHDLPRRAVVLGPLTEKELISLKQKVKEPKMTLLFREGHLEPSINELGFPAPPDKQAKLLELLDQLEEQNILRQVPRGTGKFVSAGYAVRKGGNGVRLVVRYCSLNERLLIPKGVKHHSMTDFVQGLPHFGKFFSVLDVKDAFYRIKLNEDAKTYLNMSIWTNSGFREYEWLRAPQGLSISPSYWCAMIDNMLLLIQDFLKNHPLYGKFYKRTLINA